MITVAEAESLISGQIQLLPSHDLQLEALGSELLREDLFADQPLPPFDRVAMDGIAICWSAWQRGQRSFEIEGLQQAGAPQRRLQDRTACLEVMTGAILPAGADAIIPYEELELGAGEARLKSGVQVKPGQHVHQRGSDYAQGDLLLPAGCLLQAPQWAVAASIGKSSLRVSQRPRIAVISTGDELVPVNQTPLAHQIRQSNGYLIRAALQAQGYTQIQHQHCSDQAEVLAQELEARLAGQAVLILTGGVSMGKYDFIPEVLTALGVSCIFHKVRQKPGKPLWFGVGPQQQLVFALPGNPVAVAICLYRYVLPALKQLSGQKNLSRPFAVLQENIRFAKALTYFQPVRVSYAQSGQILASPVPWNGSGDFAALAQSDGFLELPAEREQFLAEEAFPLCLWNL